jgi:hypothetical protein
MKINGIIDLSFHTGKGIITEMVLFSHFAKCILLKNQKTTIALQTLPHAS